MAIKDNMLVVGEKCTSGSKILENYIPPYDATVVTKLKKRLSGDDKGQLMNDIRYAPAWIGNIFRQLREREING